MALRFRLHPWDPDTLYTVTEYDHEPDGGVDVSVELPEAEWRPLAPASTPARTVRFVDGARRHDAAATFGDRPCLFAVVGVGSVASRLGAPVAPPEPRPPLRRVFVSGEDVSSLGPVELPRYGVRYEPVGVEGGEASLAAAAQRLMLQEERDLAERLATEHPEDLVVVDGPLRMGRAHPNVLGYVKTTSRELLPRSLHPVLDALGPYQRTPVYRVQADERRKRYEWVMRPRAAARGVDPRMGLVRLQAASSLPFDQVRALADWSAAVLPEYSSDYHHDTRAPQQLLIVKALEGDLRRTFGDRDLLLGALRGAFAT